MAQTYIIAINKSGKPTGQPQVTFNPPSQTVNAGDVIYWRNNDSAPHWPAPTAGEKNDWMDFQIPGKLPDQPAPTSQQAVTFGAGTKGTKRTVQYYDANDPASKGEIVVQS